MITENVPLPIIYFIYFNFVTKETFILFSLIFLAERTKFGVGYKE